MKQYLDFLNHILTHGVTKDDRTGVGTVSTFGYQMRFDLRDGFPLVTTKRLHQRSIAYELLWFLRGETNIQFLKDHGVTIWDEWADANGNVGPIYGKQWVRWQAADGRVFNQIADTVEAIRHNPNSRRLLVSAWNVGEIDRMALPPCHVLFQFNVTEGRLSCHLYMRSMDAMLGTPFNIASYALLTHMMAQQCDLGVGDFILSGGDCHIYRNHVDLVRQQLGRTPYPLPQLLIRRRPPSIFEYQFEDFEFVNYQAHPPIKAPVAV